MWRLGLASAWVRSVPPALGLSGPGVGLKFRCHIGCPFSGVIFPRSKLSTLFDFSTQPQKTLDLKSVWASSAKAVRGSAWLTLAVGMLGLPKTG